MANTKARIFGLKIEGVGPSDGSYDGAGMPTDRRYRFATEIPTWDTKSLYRRLWRGFPSFPATSVSFLDMGAVVFGTSDVELFADDAVSIGSKTLLTLLCKSNPKRLYRLGSTMSASATTMHIQTEAGANKTGLKQQILWLAREAIFISSEVGSGVYNVTRACFETIAAEHDAGEDFEIFAELVELTDRRIDFFEVDMESGAYTDEDSAANTWGGFALSDVAESEDGLGLMLSGETLAALVQNRPICSGMWRGTVTAAGQGRLQGYSRSVEPGIVCQHAGSSPFKLGIFCAGGFVFKGVHYENAGSTYVNYIPGSTYNPADFLAINEPPADLGELLGSPIWEVILTDPAQPSFDGAGAKFSQNPIAIARSLLTTTAGGQNGAYDLAVGRLGAALPAGALDADSWDRLEAEFDGHKARLALHLDGKPADAWELITSKIFPSLQVTFTPGAKIGVERIKGYPDYVAAGVAHIQEANCIEPPRWTRNLPASFDEPLMLIGGYLGAEEERLPVRGIVKRARKLKGRRSQIEVDATIYAEPADWPVQAGVNIAEQWRDGLPIYDVLTDGDLKLVPGSRCLLTHPRAIGPTGARGVSSLPCVVMSQEPFLGEEGRDHFIKYTLLGIGAVVDKFGFIAPSMKVSDWSAATNMVEVHRHYYSDDDGDFVTPDSSGFVVGESVEALDADFDRQASSYQSIVIVDINELKDVAGSASLSKDQIELHSSFSGTLTAGDVIVHSAHGTTGTNATAESTWTYFDQNFEWVD